MSLLLRHPLRWIAAMLAVAGAVLVAAEASPASPQQLRGVQTHLLWGGVDSAEVRRQLDLVRTSGADLIRVDLGWSSLEADGRGRYDAWYLGRIDTVVREAEARDVRVLFTLTWTPCWASTAPESLKRGCSGEWWDRGVHLYPPADPRAYGDALAFLVKRYGRRVEAWEVWNEPNNDSYFKVADRAASYAALLKAAYPAAKAADPAATVLGGALMHADHAFAEELYGHGVAGHFDGFSIHPYSEDRSPLDAGDPRWASGSFTSGVPMMRELMLRHGDDKPLWLTEFGWSTATLRDGAAWRNGVSAEEQARYLREAYDRMRDWSYVRAGVWFKLTDRGGDRADTVDNYGLVRVDGSPKPAFAAFRAAAGAAGQPPRAASPPPRRRATRRASVRSLRASRRGARVRLAGRATGTRSVQVRLYRARGARSARRRPVYTLRLRVRRDGRFRGTIARSRLRSGRWLVRAAPRRGSRSAASVVVA